MTQQQVEIHESAVSSNALSVVEALFQRWQASGVGYCHWKSNAHLDAALAGRTDLDILVAAENKDCCGEALIESNYRRVMSHGWQRYPDVEDWIGLDNETGRLVHMHLHYALVLGEKHAKNYHLPVETWILNNTTELHDVRVPVPEVEIIILYVRCLQKLDRMRLLRGILRDRLKGTGNYFPHNIQDEIIWLKERINRALLQRLIDESLIPISSVEVTDFIERFETGKLHARYLLRQQTAIRKKLQPYRRFPAWRCATRRLAAAINNSRSVSRFPMLRRQQKKTLPDMGRIFAFVGADGSGKSSLVKDVQAWLAWKLETDMAYMGKRRDRVSRYLGRCRNRFTRDRFANGLATGLAPLCQDLAAVYQAWQRRRLYRRATRMRQEGHVVIIDRFPLHDFWTMAEPMDGPRLLAKNNWLARLERRFYEDIALPDRVFVLRAPLDVLRKRKNDIAYEMHVEKVAAIESLTPTSCIKLVDVHQTYPEVLTTVKELVWEMI